MNDLDIFQYAGQQVRTSVIDGEPCVLLADVITALDMRSSPAQVANRLPDGVRKTDTISDRFGRAQRAVFVTEPGLYRVVMRSSSPKAEPFIEWVTADVLPTIRRTGRYGNDVDMLAALPSSRLLALAAEAAERAEAAEAKIALDAPKVDYVDTFVRNGDVSLFRNVAKRLGMKESELRDDLLSRKWIYVETIERWSKTKQEDIEVHRYSAYADKARYFYPAPTHDAPKFKGEVMHTLKITPRGAIALAKLYNIEPSAMIPETVTA